MSIEPLLAFLCEAYSEDEAPDEGGKMEPRVVLRLHPRIAPVKAAVFPLVKQGRNVRDRSRDLWRSEAAFQRLL